MTGPQTSGYTAVTGEHRVITSPLTEEIGFMRAVRSATSDGPQIQMPANTPNDERWIWENPEIVGQILKGSDEMARGNIVRRVIPGVDD